jgi:hypothetical protein
VNGFRGAGQSADLEWVEVKVTQSQLRHTTPKITLESYAQVVSDDQKKAHQKVVQMVVPKQCQRG